jgi:hypothetical protein
MNFLPSFFVFIVTAYASFGINSFARSETLPVSSIVLSDSLKTIVQDSLSIDSLLHASNSEQVVTDTSFHDFGTEYNNFLDKADRAYKIGLFKRAIRLYREALIINPQSLYIKYRLKEIEQQRANQRNFIFYFNFDKPDILVKSITFFTLYFAVSLFVVLVVILIHRQQMQKDENRKQVLREKYQQYLVDYLFTTANENDKEILDEIKKISFSNYSRKLLIDQMIDLSINLTGDVKEKLRELYFSLELDKDSIKKAFSPKWHIKVKGFRELAFMNLHDANEEIIRCLLSNNDVLRMEAQLAMVRLNVEDPFGFLDHLDKPFTLWEQLTIYETIMFHNLQIPQFDRWLFSRNKSVVLFAIRMIDIFKQREAYHNLFWMLVNEDPEIRSETIKVIGNLKIKDALSHLKRLYKNETYENCLEIVRAMAKMPDQSVLNFFKLVIDKEDDVQLQIAATIAINNMGELGKRTLEKLMDSDYKNYKIIIKHVLDKRIS